MFYYMSFWKNIDCWKQTWISPFCWLPCERAQGRQQEAWATAQVPPFLKRVKHVKNDAAEGLTDVTFGVDVGKEVLSFDNVLVTRN